MLATQLLCYFVMQYSFNGVYARGGGLAGEWITRGETRDFWIQIRCPDLVRL